MNRRFFSPQKIDGSTVLLASAEAHHLLHVLRAQPGSEWTVFDGSGCEYRVRLTSVTKRSAELEVIERVAVDRELSTQLHLVVAFPKGDRQKWLIEKCVELGVHELSPLNSARSVVKCSATSIDKLQRIVVESSKQCGRNQLMQVHNPIDFETMVKTAESPSRWIALPEAVPMSMRLADAGQVVTAIVGPEGGFTDEEIASAAAHDWMPLSLGNRILRIETAAVAIAAVVGNRAMP